MIRDVTCIVCDSGRNATLYDANFSGTASEASDYFLSHRTKTAHGRIVVCLGCGFIYTSPQFTPAQYDAIYQAAPQQPSDGVDFAAAEKLRFTRIAAFVRSHAKPGPFLDFGCGDGGFLDVMNDDRGVGFDVGHAGLRTSVGGHEIVTGDFSCLQQHERFAAGAFSFVTAFDVLEHLPDLPAYLDELHRLIHSDGHLIVTVPNVKSLAARLTGEKWNMILLEHLWYFSPHTLQRMLARHGFEHVATRNMSYEAPLSHFFNRLTQTYRLKPIALPKRIASLVIPVPIGLMAAVFRRI